MKIEELQVLSKDEQNELKQCEQVIAEGLQTFINVGRALLKIKEDKLYRSEFSSFEKYCKVRFGYTGNYCRRLIQASIIVQSLPQSVPTGTLSERSIRPATVLKNDSEKAKAIGAAITEAEAENRAVTSKDVQKQVDKFLSDKIEDADFEDVVETKAKPVCLTNQYDRLYSAKKYIDEVCEELERKSGTTKLVRKLTLAYNNIDIYLSTHRRLEGSGK